MIQIERHFFYGNVDGIRGFLGCMQCVTPPRFGGFAAVVDVESNNKIIKIINKEVHKHKLRHSVYKYFLYTSDEIIHSPVSQVRPTFCDWSIEVELLSLVANGCACSSCGYGYYDRSVAVIVSEPDLKDNVLSTTCTSGAWIVRNPTLHGSPLGVEPENVSRLSACLASGQPLPNWDTLVPRHTLPPMLNRFVGYDKNKICDECGTHGIGPSGEVPAYISVSEDIASVIEKQGMVYTAEWSGSYHRHAGEQASVGFPYVLCSNRFAMHLMHAYGDSFRFEPVRISE